MKGMRLKCRRIPTLEACAISEPMSQQAEAGDIGCPVQVERGGKLCGTLVQPFHPIYRFADLAVDGLLAFDGSGDHPEAERFGQHQRSPIRAPPLLMNFSGMDKTEDDQPIFRLFVLDGVPAGQDHARFDALSLPRRAGSPR